MLWWVKYPNIECKHTFLEQFEIGWDSRSILIFIFKRFIHFILTLWISKVFNLNTRPNLPQLVFPPKKLSCDRSFRRFCTSFNDYGFQQQLTTNVLRLNQVKIICCFLLLKLNVKQNKDTFEMKEVKQKRIRTNETKCFWCSRVEVSLQIFIGHSLREAIIDIGWVELTKKAR